MKNNYGTIGVNAKVPRKDCSAGTVKAFHTESIAQWALNAGKSIGLVTTTRGWFLFSLILVLSHYMRL